MKDLSCQEIQNILEASESRISFMIDCAKARAENPAEYWELFQ